MESGVHQGCTLAPILFLVTIDWILLNTTTPHHLTPHQIKTLYNSNVKSVLLHSSECWRVVKGDIDEISAFHNGCLRKICRVFLPNKVSNEELYRKTGCSSVAVLRVDQGSAPKVVLRWTPPGKAWTAKEHLAQNNRRRAERKSSDDSKSMRWMAPDRRSLFSQMGRRESTN